jgi:hypothetical protein
MVLRVLGRARGRVDRVARVACEPVIILFFGSQGRSGSFRRVARARTRPGPVGRDRQKMSGPLAGRENRWEDSSPGIRGSYPGVSAT